MKNLIDPQILAELKQDPSFERIGGILESNKEITATSLCRLVGVDPQQYFNWKSRSSKRSSSGAAGDLEIIPTGAEKKRYSADDKLKLVKRYGALEGEARAELLRKYGLYDSDFARWRDQADGAALAALSTRKPRSDKRSEEQLEIERLKQELRSQEKTIAKLSALVVVQKKVSDFLMKEEDD